MKIYLKGNFGKQTDQAEILKANGIDVNMNDGKFYFEYENDNELLKIFEIMKGNYCFIETISGINKEIPMWYRFSFKDANNDDLLKVLGVIKNNIYNIFFMDLIDDIKKELSLKYNANVNLYALYEDYSLKQDENAVEIRNTARSFKLIKEEKGDFPSYKFEFFDHGIDFDYLDNREFIYCIKENDKMYDIFKSLLDDINDGVLRDYTSDDKIIYLDEYENNIYLIFKKKVASNTDNSLNIGTATNCDKWLAIDKLYNSLTSKTKRR